MNSMNYKGYVARIEFDGRDNIFVGRVLKVQDIISFHAESVAQLRDAFHAAVDDWLADGDERGLQLEKLTSSPRVSLRTNAGFEHVAHG